MQRPARCQHDYCDFGIFRCLLSTRAKNVRVIAAANVKKTLPLLLLALLASLLRTSYGCYAFPADVEDPCLEMECEFGAQCVVSMDGNSARCQVSDVL